MKRPAEPRRGGRSLPVALTIAGSDSGGGAGIQADLKTFAAGKVYGASVLTAVTAQNTRRVVASRYLSPALVGEQLDAVLSDLRPAAVKTGMLGTAGIIRVVARRLAAAEIKNLVIDPVMVATSGDYLLEADALPVLVKKLFPLALIVTPNLAEASRLAGFPVRSRREMVRAARVIGEMGPRNVLIKGGHRRRDANDLLYDGKKVYIFTSPRMTKEKIHGAGCTFSSAITAALARGASPRAACAAGKRFIVAGLKNPLRPGRGAYTVNWGGRYG